MFGILYNKNLNKCQVKPVIGNNLKRFFSSPPQGQNKSLAQKYNYFIYFINAKKVEKIKKYCHELSPFHKTLPRYSAFVNWMSVRFYEMDCILFQDMATEEELREGVKKILVGVRAGVYFRFEIHFFAPPPS